ncbi:MAG: serine/threonine protein kinase [Deltaproteobacteria bacterium]|nr:serine/threonine protein kinase [Deltaproteobacteria bacterium]
MSTDPLERTVLDERYDVRTLIGGGGMGLVYRARQRGIVSRDVAIKVLRIGTSDPAARERFHHEARIVGSLRHPNTIKLFDAGQLPDGRPYVVTELLRGRPLDVLLKSKPIPVDKVLRFALQAAGSLREAHEEGIVHRDLKPANIFIEDIGSEEVLKVLDFGLAFDSRGAGQALTEAGFAVGTPEYMSPEQILGQAVGPRSDIYSLGATLYESLCSEPVFAFGAPYVTMAKHVNEEPVPVHLRERGKSVPIEISDLVRRMLSKSPDGRPGSMAELRVELARLLRPLEAALPEAKWTEVPTLLEEAPEGFDRQSLEALRAEAHARRNSSAVAALPTRDAEDSEPLVPISIVETSELTRRDDSLARGFLPDPK